jgi:PKD domain/Fibronectin type III domain
MGLRRWQRLAMAAILTAGSLAVPATSVLARPATTPPVASLTASPTIALSDADDVYFNAGATKDTGCTGTASYQFNFGDGTVSTPDIEVSTYAYAYHYFHVDSGTQMFTVSMTVTDCGQSDTVSLNETVVHDTGPTAAVTITNSGSQADTIFADASASTASAPATLYEFVYSWGDGTSGATYAPHESLAHTYTSPGTYPVSVDVFDDAGVDAATSPVSMTVPFTSPATSPSISKATPGDSKATINWVAPTSGGTPSQYIVNTYADDQTSPITGTFPGTQVRATITGLTDETTYSFTVTAVVGGVKHVSPRSNPILPVGKPGSPSVVNAVQDNNAAVVQWKPPTMQGSKPLSYHQGINYTVNITATNAPKVKAFPVTGDPAPTNATIPGLKPGGTYTFTVTASTVTSTGATLTSPPSGASTAVILVAAGPTITDQPQLKLVEPSTVGSSGTDLSVIVNVVWTAAPVTTPPTCGYELQRSINGAAFSDDPSTLLTTTSFNDTIAPANPPSLVRYQVRAVASTDCSNPAVTPVDSAWGQSSQFAGRELADTASSKFTYSQGNWTNPSCPNCTDQEDKVTMTNGATVILTLNSAFNIGLIFTDEAGFGSVSVKVALADGTSVTKTVNTSTAPHGFRQLLFKTGWSMFQAATITVTNLGTAPIDFDGAVVLYAPLARTTT